MYIGVSKLQKIAVRRRNAVVEDKKLKIAMFGHKCVPSRDCCGLDSARAVE